MLRSVLWCRNKLNNRVYPNILFAGSSGGLNGEGVDVCQAVLDLCFVECDDNAFALLIATQHPSGGRVELWELKETQLITHKIFLPSEGSQQDCPKNIVPVWQYQEVFVAGSSAAQGK